MAHLERRDGERPDDPGEVGQRRQPRVRLPGVVFAYARNTYTNTSLRKAGIEVITIRDHVEL